VKADNFYCIIADETSDNSCIEQLSFCLRHVNDDFETFKEPVGSHQVVLLIWDSGMKSMLTLENYGPMKVQKTANTLNPDDTQARPVILTSMHKDLRAYTSAQWRKIL